ncbi:MAG: helicase-related protein [Gaiellaceae bacterium]
MSALDIDAVCIEATGRTVLLPGHFVGPVKVEEAQPLGADGIVYLRVRTGRDELRDLPISAEELAAALSNAVPTTRTTVPANDFFLLVESARIRLAFAHDPHFAVALTGIEVLPHQLEAVYERMLPQVMLRFLLADDPGAGKTIMSGLLIKELRLRNIVERVLVLCPSPLTIQWQDELAQKFDESFELMTSERVKGTLSSNPWNEYQRCIASIDLAKRPEVRERLLEANWDLVIVDEAHKCSARTDGDKVTKTHRFQLVERLSPKAERLLLLTATPHQGNADQFGHFLRLLDEDQFIDLERDKKLIQLEGNPWYLRRMKEDMRDFEGRRLFTERHARTQPFKLVGAEYELYDEVTRYINDFLPRVTGKRKHVFALTRIVFQRRLASSLAAITSSLGRRHKRLGDMLAELDALPETERAKKLEHFRLIEVSIDDEMESDDETDEEQELLIDSAIVAETIDRLREEVDELNRLVKLARDTMAVGTEAKLDALKSCLARAEFAELKDGRGKLLIFTEHKDTLAHLVTNLEAWGYTTTTIHGGLSPQERKQRQIEFQRDAQVCVATEAAGEGINLQFCHLMINYDMPWNPMRLEQRMGRIHRIGQQHDVYVFNFAAENTIEGMIVARLLEKLQQIKETLGDRVFDVIGELLKINDVNFEDLLREAAYNPKDINEYLDEIERIDPERLKEYERATGIALAKSHVDLATVRGEDWRSQERRLMPEFVEGFFVRASEATGLQVDLRADGLWRADHVPALFREDGLRSVQRLGRASQRYSKFTFRKEQARESKNLDGELVSPGHPLFAAVDEVMNGKVASTRQGIARYLDPFSPSPYRLHFYEVEVEGGTVTGTYEPATGTLVTVVEDDGGSLALGAPDILHDLTPAKERAEVELSDETVERVRRWVMGNVQHPMTTLAREERVAEAAIRKEYLQESFEISIRRARERWMRFADQVAQGDENLKLTRDNALRDVEALERRRDEKLSALENIAVVAAGKIEYLGTASVEPTELAGPGMRRDEEVELAAMEHVLAWEREQGWEPTDVSKFYDGSGFDIRSVGPADENGQRAVKRIEVKGRAGDNQPVELTPNEWVQAGRHRDTFWLYVVWNAKTKPRLLRVQDPVRSLRDDVEEFKVVNGYRVPAAAITRAAQ